MASGLLEQVKGKLRITWEDAATDARIQNVIMPSAEADLRDLLGIDVEGFDFGEPGQENILFLAHCYYEWNDALDEFEGNYGPQIARCRERWMVRQYAEESQAPADVP